ncbi:MAG: hypothetical protein IJG62_00080 [Synergistaceae bacterium]|nr:hypothetical protein [Synergistaceae bacterium]
MDLRGIEELIDQLSFKVEALIKERDELKLTVSRLNAYASERDKECVLTRREFNRKLEELYEDSIKSERNAGSSIENELERLNERLLALADKLRYSQSEAEHSIIFEPKDK